MNMLGVWLIAKSDDIMKRKHWTGSIIKNKFSNFIQFYNSNCAESQEADDWIIEKEEKLRLAKIRIINGNGQVMSSFTIPVASDDTVVVNYELSK